MLWGTAEVEAYLWPGATACLSGRSPRKLGAQAAPFRVPVHDRALYLHQLRPLVSTRPAVTLVHDTIPLRYERRPLIRAAKYAYLRLACSRSVGILTVSSHSADQIARDLAVERSRIRVLEYPIDSDAVRRIRALRESMTDSGGYVIYVGRLAPHKNVEMLIRAFSRTAYAAGGGTLMIVCANSGEGRRVETWALQAGVANAVVPMWGLSQEHLESVFAGADALVQPSTDEGFGLPVWEARSCGLPRCVSAIEPLMSLSGADAVRFDPTDVTGMAHAIDDVVLEPWAEPLLHAPTVRDFAAAVLDGLEHFAPSPPSVGGRLRQPRQLAREAGE